MYTAEQVRTHCCPAKAAAFNRFIAALRPGLMAASVGGVVVEPALRAHTFRVPGANGLKAARASSGSNASHLLPS